MEILLCGSKKLIPTMFIGFSGYRYLPCYLCNNLNTVTLPVVLDLMFVVVNFALKRFLHFLDVLVGNQSVTRLSCKTDTDRTFLFLILQLCYFNVDQKEIPFKYGLYSSL